jgi:hypothetical protein
MISLLRHLGLLVLAFALVLPSFAADSPSSKTDTKSDKKKDTKKETEDEYVTMGQFEGVVGQPGGRLKMQVITMVPDQAAINKLAQLQAQVVREKAQGNRNNGFNAAAIQRTMAQMAVQQAAVARGKEQKVDKTFDVADDAKVRVAEPPVEFDDKGVRKKLSSTEMKAKKGPGNLWGFPGTVDQVSKGQNVKVFVGLKKSVIEALKKKKKPTGKSKTEDDVTDESSPVVHMIYILSEAKK